MLPLLARVDPGAIAMTGYFAFPKAPALQSLTIKLFDVISRIFVGRRGLTPLQRYRRCIQQPLPTGLSIFLADHHKHWSYTYMCMCVCVSTCVCVCLCVCVCVCTSMSLYLFFSLSLFLSPSVCLSVSELIWEKFTDWHIDNQNYVIYTHIYIGIWGKVNGVCVFQFIRRKINGHTKRKYYPLNYNKVPVPSF